ncbi:MAG: phosphoglycerate dehydrogenase [Oscillospiraceae bacterium]|nr:phosphoglycerate dehydrogenase [Oscillospiraceae bacterium]
MYTIRSLNKIAPIGLDLLDPAQFTLNDNEQNPEGILLRSADMHSMELPDNLLAVSRAGAGVNNIPLDACAEKGIVVFNTPGANANAVRELAVCALFLASRNITAGIKWASGLEGDDVAKQIEKGKSAFAGPEIMGKTLGVVGLGAIGVGVANAAHHLGMNVLGFDPYISVDAAWGLSRSVSRYHDFNKLLAECDYLSIHAPLNTYTKHMINSVALSLMKPGVRIINFARAELVNDDDMISALDSGRVSCYVTDFPNGRVNKHPKVVPIPHLGASTPESEDNCAVMAVQEMSNYLVFGNIKNSVNYPDVELARTTPYRLCVIHRNIPSMLSSISSMVGDAGINIDNMLNKSLKEYAYTILDVSTEIDNKLLESLMSVEGIIKVRVLKS